MSQARMTIGTLNNPTVGTEEFLEGWSKVPGVVFVTGQLEKGAEGTPHIQYFVQTDSPRRVGFFKLHCSKSHFKFVKKNNGADEYCNKEDTRLEGPFEFGVRPARRDKKGDLARRNAQLREIGAQKAVDEGLVSLIDIKKLDGAIHHYNIISDVAVGTDEPKGVWIYGAPGAGKSHYARRMYPGYFLKAQNKWFDGYQKETHILLDDLDTDVLSHLLKIWMDEYPVSNAECKGLTIPLMHTKFIVTSNYTIEELFKDDSVRAALNRRCEVIKMTDREPQAIHKFGVYEQV